MKNRRIALLLLFLIAAVTVAGTKISRLTRTRTLPTNSMFVVVTGDVTKGTRYITDQDLALELGRHITNSGSGGSATNAVSSVQSNSVTVASPSTLLNFIEGTNIVIRSTNTGGSVSIEINASGSGSGEPSNGDKGEIQINAGVWRLDIPVLTNIVQTGISQGATNAGFYIGSDSGGKGTNTELTGTNKIFGELRIASRLYPTNGFTIQDALIASTNDSWFYQGGNFDFGYNATGLRGSIYSGNTWRWESGSAGTFLNGSTLRMGDTAYLTDGADNVTNQYEFQGTTFKTSTNVVIRKWEMEAAIRGEKFYTTNLLQSYNWATALSNAPSFSYIKLQAGTNSITPYVVLSNRFGGINLIGKTNVVIDGGGAVTISGRAAIGDLLYMSNCANITIRGIRFDGLVLTNTSLVPAPASGYQWGNISIANSDRPIIEDCEIVNAHNFGLIDWGIDKFGFTATTNGIFRRNRVENCGSHFDDPYPLDYDGAGIAVIGWTIEDNEFVNCLSGIETYEDTSGLVTPATIIRRNRIRNTIHYSIFNLGHTNADRLIIEDNFIQNDVGYLRRGSNYFSDASGISIGSGHKHQINRNTIIGPTAYGIILGSALAPRMDEMEVGNNIVDGSENSYIVGGGAVTYAFHLNFYNNSALNGRAPFHFAGLRDASVIGNKATRVYTTGNEGFFFRVVGGYANTNVLVSGNFAFDDQGNMDYGFSSDSGNINMVFGVNQSIGHTAGVLNGTVTTRGMVGTTGVPEFSESIALTSLGTNGFLRTGAGGIVTTGIIGANLSMSADGTLSASGGVGGFITNQYTTNITGTPVLGSLWFADTNGAPLTNGPRLSSLEYVSVMRTIRQGDVGAQGAGHDGIDTQSVSNYWNATNQGFGSVAFGSNNWAWGNYSLIGNGMFNLIGSNAVGSSILGGSNNVIHTNSAFAIIGGGSINKVRMNSPHSAIVGGFGNEIHDSDFSFIGGGQVNDVGAAGISINSSVVVGGNGNSIQSDLGFIGGGVNNSISTSSTHGVIGGGSNNDISPSAIEGTIGGGGANKIFDGSTSGAIAGGNGNNIGANGGAAATFNSIGGGSGNIVQAGSDYSTIAGGRAHLIGGTPSSDLGAILGGASNNIATSVNMATVIGNFVTNATTASIELGVSDTNKVRIDRTNLWLIGSTKIRMTNGASAGRVLTDVLGDGDLTLAAPSGGASSPITTNAYTPFPLTLTGTNRIADGAIGNLFSNVFLIGPTETNILADNMRDGQTLVLWLYPDTGVIVKFPQFQNASNYTDGGVITLATNIMSRVEITRRGIYTNLVVATRTWELIPSTGITFTTNFVTGTITVTSSGGGGAGTNANQFGASSLITIKDGAWLTNSRLWGLTTNMSQLYSESGAGASVVALNSGGVVAITATDLVLGVDNTTRWRLEADSPHLGSLIPHVANAYDVGSMSFQVRSNVTMNLMTSNSLVHLGGTLGAGKVLTDVSGNGSATWETPTGGTTPDSLQFFNVRTNGATGDGVTDDTLSITNTIAMASAAGGGVVFFPRGSYLIKRPIVVPSSIELRGSGTQTKITKPASVRYFLTNGASLAAGAISVTLSNITGLESNAAIYLADTTSFEWLSTKAIITNINPVTFTVSFSVPTHGQLQTNRGAFITTDFPLIRNAADLTTNIVIRDLVLDQNRTEMVSATNDFTLGTIHYEGNFNGRVENVTLLNAAGDAYSDQGTNGLSGFTPTTNYIRAIRSVFTGSRVRDSGRHALHFGTCMEGAIVSNNEISNAGRAAGGVSGFAIFYCAYATYITAIGNMVANCYSGFAGIDMRDYGNTISGNTIRYSANLAVDGSSSGSDGTGGRLTIIGNTIFGKGIRIDQPNCTISGNAIDFGASAGEAIRLDGGADRATVQGNTIFSTGASGSIGVMLIGSTDDVRLIGNVVNGIQSAFNIQGASRLVAVGNRIGSPTSTTWNFATAQSTNIFISDEANNFSTVVTETVVPLRLVYNGVGQNGTTNPIAGGQWLLASGRMFDGVMVTWTNITAVSTNARFSIYKLGSGWTELLTAGLATLLTATNATSGDFTNTLNWGLPYLRLGVTNATLFMTNHTGHIANSYQESEILIQVGGGTVNKTVTWPASGLTYGLFWRTQTGGNPLWTTLTNDKTYLYTAKKYDTNVLHTISLYE